MIISNQHFNLDIQNHYTQANSSHNIRSQKDSVNQSQKVHMFNNVEISKPAKSAVVYMGTEGSLSENLLIQTRLLDFSMNGGKTMEVSHKAFNDGEAMELSKNDADDLLNGFYSVKEVVSRYVKANLISNEKAEEIADTPLEELDLNSLIDSDLDLEKIKEDLLKDHEDLEKLHPELAKFSEETFDEIIDIIDEKIIDKQSDKEARKILGDTGDDEESIREAIDEIHKEIADEMSNNPDFTELDKKIKEATIDKLEEALDEIAKKKEEEKRAKEQEEAKAQESVNQETNESVDS